MRVWIDQGCIGCRACEYECPEVFRVEGATSTVRCELDDDMAARYGERIANAAGGCPVSVIKIEREPAAALCARAAG